VANQPGIVEALLTLLSHPNIASKDWIIRQYDHEVQGATVLKPLVGPLGRGPGDAAVIRPVADSNRGLAVACGLATGVGDPAIGGDPYEMALAAIDECVRNLVCVGADPNRIAILDNFCWPSCKKPENLASLVRAAEGCYDGAKAYRTPFVSGKDSLNNQFTIPGEDGSDGRTIEIPPTLLISGIGIIPDVGRCVTSDAKRPGNSLFYVFAEEFARPGFRGGLGGSLFARRFGVPTGESPEVPRVDLEGGPMVARLISEMMRRGYIAACHDCSDGGPLVAVAEMLIAGSTAERPLGATVLAGGLLCDTRYGCFSEAPSAFIVEVHAQHADAFADLLLRGELKPEIECNGVRFGSTDDSGVLEVVEMSAEPGEKTRIPVEDLARAWRAPLDW